MAGGGAGRNRCGRWPCYSPKGLSRHRNYPVWEVGKAPDFVLEILSPSTRKKDVEDKPALYRRMGTREYFLFDPSVIPSFFVA